MILKTTSKKITNIVKKYLSHFVNPHIVVRKSGVHNKGVFAKTDIKKGEHIIEYLGKRITKAQSEKIADLEFARHKKNQKNGAVYIFELNKKHDIDGNVWYNLAKYMNHSCEPNCEPIIGRGTIFIQAKRKITAGEELTYDYGYDLEHYQDHPCRCGSKECVGFIVAKRFRRFVKK